MAAIPPQTSRDLLYVPFEANLTNDLMRLHERFCNLLKMNRFHGCLCGEPHESSLNSYNGKIRS